MHRRGPHRDHHPQRRGDLHGLPRPARRRHRPGQDIHVVLDNGSSHAAKHTKKWLVDYPRWPVQWTPPHASWLNQVELFFSTLARRVLRYGDFSSRDDLINKLESFVINHNTTAMPYKWTYDGSPLKTA
ncbi:transposase [Streptomyces griseoluteus]|uniref:transposase n=1 Tax=Streptomyces griseoluteus TaxID=29306 RepID=UPI0036998251